MFFLQQNKTHEVKLSVLTFSSWQGHQTNKDQLYPHRLTKLENRPFTKQEKQSHETPQNLRETRLTPHHLPHEHVPHDCETALRNTLPSFGAEGFSKP